MIALNLQGLLYVAHAALEHLIAAAGDDPRHVADLVNISSVAGRVARSGSGVYNLTKHGVGAFSESLRQEVTRRHVRVSIVEPGAVETELTDHLRDEVREQVASRFGGIERMQAGDIADAIRLHRHAAAARGDQRAADPPYRAGGLSPRAAAQMTKTGVPTGDRA